MGVNEQVCVCVGATIGAVAGAAMAYLFLTERGRVLRDRVEPALDDANREVMRWQRAIEAVGGLADEGRRVVHQFNEARGVATFERARPMGDSR